MKKLVIAIATSLLAPSIALAQVYPSPVVRWGQAQRTVTINWYFYDAERDAAARAMSTWNAVGPSFKWVAGGFNSYHPSGSANTRPCDAQSGIGEAFDVSSATTAAEARVCVTGGTTTIYDGDIWVNSTMITDGSFHSGTASAPSTKYDFESVILHEFGHLLRLLHDSYSTSVVMHPTISKNALDKKADEIKDEAARMQQKFNDAGKKIGDWLFNRPTSAVDVDRAMDGVRPYLPAKDADLRDTIRDSAGMANAQANAMPHAGTHRTAAPTLESDPSAFLDRMLAAARSGDADTFRQMTQQAADGEGGRALREQAIAGVDRQEQLAREQAERSALEEAAARMARQAGPVMS